MRWKFGRATWWCALLFHRESVWECRSRGLEWVCPDCQRREVSPLAMLLR